MADLKIIKECKDCGETFEITRGEEKFYRENGLRLPVRCKACRDRRRAEREEGTSSSGKKPRKKKVHHEG